MDRVKDDFLATLSHELRTPLASILLWAKLLQSKALPPEQQAEGLAAITRSAEAQKQLIEDLLDLSRLRSSRLHLDMRPNDAAALVLAAVAHVAPVARDKGVALAVHVDEGLGRVRGDAERLRQVFVILASNAVKFTPPGGHVEVRAARRGDEVEVGVADDGIGFDAAFAPSLFEPFTQADAASTRKHGGLGLGLAIARALVDRHAGSLHGESAGSGRGATFVVTLPRLAPVPGDEADDTDAPEVGGVGSPPPAWPSAGLRGGPAGAAGIQGLDVMLVEDDAETRAALTATLESRGARVTAFGSAVDALEHLARATHPVMVSDIAMPDIDGYELMKRARAAGHTRMKAIALTAFVCPDDRERARAAGFDRHLAKPIAPDALVAAIRALADGHDGRAAVEP